MRIALAAAAMLVLTSPVALSQGRSVEPIAARPAVGIGSKSMDSCSADQRKFCAATASGVMKECLVANWNRIASDCQDALATSVDRIGGSGRSRSD
jgi:hypothetical protein